MKHLRGTRAKRIVVRPWPRKLYDTHGLDLPGACEVWIGRLGWEVVNKHGTIARGKLAQDGTAPQSGLRRARRLGCQRFFLVRTDD